MAIDLEKYKTQPKQPIDLDRYKFSNTKPPMPEKQQGVVQNIAQEVASPFLRVATNFINVGGILGSKGAEAKDKARTQERDFGYFGKVKPVGQSNGGFLETAKNRDFKGGLDIFRDAAGVGAQLASYTVPVPAAKGIQATTVGGKILQGAARGAATGATSGGLYGLGTGLQEEDATVGSTLAETAKGTAFGGVGGFVVGGALAAPAAIKNRYFPSQEQATKVLEKAYDDVFRTTKAGANRLEKQISKGNNPSKFLAEQGITIDVTPDGKLDTRSARRLIQQQVDNLDDTLEVALKQQNQTVNLKDVMDDALKAVDNSKTRADGSVFARQQEVRSIFDNYKKIYGDLVPLDVLNQIKRGQYSLTKVFDATKPSFSKDVNYQIANTAKKAIETRASNIPVKEFNAYYGQHLDASNLLKFINGNTVKGGRLGRYFSRATGAVVGSMAGNSAGGPVGGAVGAYAGDMVGDAVQKSASRSAVLPTPVRRGLERGVFNQAASKADDLTQSMLNSSRVSAAKTIPTAAQKSITNMSTSLPQAGALSSTGDDFARLASSIHDDLTRGLNYEGNKQLANKIGQISFQGAKNADDVANTLRNALTPEEFGTSAVQNHLKTLQNIVKDLKLGASAKSALPPRQDAFGAVAGIEVDDEGNVTFNPTNAALGVAGMTQAQKVRALEQHAASVYKQFIKTFDKTAKKRLQKTHTALMNEIRKLKGK